MSDIDRQIKEEFEKAREHTYREFCARCYQYTQYCDGCFFDNGMKEPEMFLNALDMLLQCELEASND